MKHQPKQYSEERPKTFSWRFPLLLLVIPLSLLLFLTGCTSMLKMPQPDMSVLKPAGPVTTVVAAWEPAVSNGENSQRGFGGRIYLYDQEMLRPVKAKGTIVVYVFDEDGRSPLDAKPNEGHVFEAKVLNSKEIYKKSSLGHSYNLWVPVDAAGPEGPAKKVSLIVRYVPEKGASVVSSQATVLLPGRREAAALVPQWQTQSETVPIYQSKGRTSIPRGEFPVDRLQAMETVTIR